MPTRFHITGSRTARPSADRIIFCDGGVDDTYREGIDLELSHWIPNRTPAALKADTSTEICMKFAETDDNDGFGLLVNNHVDVDGVLAVFVLSYADLAVRHRATIVQAAEIGDFWGWGESPAQELFQALACLMEQLQGSGVDPQEIYARCFDRVQAVLAGERFGDGSDGVEALNASVVRIEDGVIARTATGSHFVHYAVPRRVAESDLEAILSVPRFNAPFSSRNPLPPHARARRDGERVQLVSVETAGGWYYDLWYPGYAWADTVRRWRPPGMSSAGSSNVHHLDCPALTGAVAELTKHETGDGRWRLARKLSPFATVTGRNFSVVLSFVNDGRPARSSLPPDAVAQALAPAFAGT